MGALESIGRMSDIYARQLEALRARSLDRHLREISSLSGAIVDFDGKRLINFPSNDYLGLANDPQLREAATEPIVEFGVGNRARSSIFSTAAAKATVDFLSSNEGENGGNGSGVTSTSWRKSCRFNQPARLFLGLS